jgi:hypothetical protein
MATRRLDDRIRQLCSEAVNSRNSDHARTALADLRNAIREYVNRVRYSASALASGPMPNLHERRKV